ncbi:hypothetical protein HDU81_003974 [Chytriomyces hyalinus]|nr:hypothetical protein HDU81_003974 [Chytriomyces hyalinus]
MLQKIWFTFSCQTFLSFNARNPQWKCIVCNQIIQQNDLILDVDMMRLLLKYPNAEKCVIRSDGSDDVYVQSAMPVPVSIRANGQGETDIKAEVAESSNKRTISEVISLDSDDDDRAAALLRRKAMRLARNADKPAHSAEKPTHDQSKLEVIVVDD